MLSQMSDICDEIPPSVRQHTCPSCCPLAWDYKEFQIKKQKQGSWTGINVLLCPHVFIYLMQIANWHLCLVMLCVYVHDCMYGEIPTMNCGYLSVGPSCVICCVCGSFVNIQDKFPARPLSNRDSWHTDLPCAHQPEELLPPLICSQVSPRPLSVLTLKVTATHWHSSVPDFTIGSVCKENI